jgi:orotidine-5'-phosphate decarboxylase
MLNIMDKENINMHFYEKLDAITTKNNSLVCVGLDTDIAKIPPHLLTEENPVLAFNRNIIEATRDLVQCYKLNLAFYEALGSRAYETIKGTIDAIPSGIIIIGDAKRGDIGNTSTMYAKALFEDFSFDAATVAPYMGTDSVQPFLRFEEKGTFILALTSNKGSQDFQYLEVEGKPLYKHVVEKIISWNDKGNCGMVVGATHPYELVGIRNMAGDMPILIPGLGAQGGEVEASVKGGINKDGMRAIFNSSRGILFAGSGEDYALRARDAALAFRDEINGFRVQP